MKTAKSKKYKLCSSTKYMIQIQRKGERERQSEEQDKLYRKSKQFIWRIRMKFK